MFNIHVYVLWITKQCSLVPNHFSDKYPASKVYSYDYKLI